jgi:HK97 family phage major capsid protein/HK97 family phage prohead protease
MADKRMKCGKLVRSMFQLPSDAAERAKAINAEARTVQLAFSSELPVGRWFGNEILDHGAKSVRLGRLNNSGALLVDHRGEPVGVVESANIDPAGRRGTAVVRFGKSARAQEVFADVQDGIRPHVSVGYAIHEMVLEKSGDDGDTYRATDWEPYEISMVSVPADPTVGVGRTAEGEEHEIIIREIPDNTNRGGNIKMTKEQEEQARREREEAAAAAQRTGQDAVVAERNRVKEIRAMAAQFVDVDGVRALADAADNNGDAVATFQRNLVDHLAKKKPVPSAELGMSRNEVKRFNWLRALRALAYSSQPEGRKFMEEAAYEREVSAEAAKLSGKTAQGIMVPVDVLRAPLVQEGQGGLDALMRLVDMMGRRDLQVGTSTAGGHTVATNLLSASFIDLLRNRMALQRLGITTLNGLVGNIAIPRQTSGATAYWVAESGAPTESQQAFDQVTMTPKTVGAFTDYSRKLLLQSSIDVENFIRMDLTKVIGLELDRVGLYGTGAANMPQGLRFVTGLNTTDLAAAAPTWAEVVGMESKVAAANADIGTLAYLVNANMRGTLKTTVKVAGFPEYIWDMQSPNSPVNGYRTEVSNQSIAGDLWFGNWADLLMGLWSGLDLMVDPYTGSTSGTVRIVALQDVDVVARHGESFCRAADTL